MGNSTSNLVKLVLLILLLVGSQVFILTTPVQITQGKDFFEAHYQKNDLP